MTAFALAISALFADRNMAEDATHIAGGTGPSRSARVIVSRPDEAIGFGDTEILTSTFVIEVQRSVVPALARGDKFQLRGTLYTVHHDPRLDPLGLVWRCGLVPDDAN